MGALRSSHLEQAKVYHVIKMEACLAGAPKMGQCGCPVRKGRSSKLKLVSQGPFTTPCGFVFACWRDLFRAAGVEQNACTDEMSSREDAKALLIIRNE